MRVLAKFGTVFGSPTRKARERQILPSPTKTSVFHVPTLEVEVSGN
jgi:hypothetical protein